MNLSWSCNKLSDADLRKNYIKGFHSVSFNSVFTLPLNQQMTKLIKKVTPFSSNSNKEDFNRLSHLIMFLAIAVGIYVRIKGLGRWPLAVDEYYIAKSVKNILIHGLPQFECGGYYVRGLLYQYIAAPFLFFCSNDEFYLRIIPVFFNLLAIPPLYWLGKRLSGSTVACIAVAFFSLSLWEIEFARFARMYAPFQTIFLWYILFVYRVIVDQSEKYEKWLHVLSFVAIFVYEGSIFLLLLNFLPLIFNTKTNWKANIFTKVALLSFGYIFLSFDFRHLGVENYLPPDIPITVAHEGRILLPHILLQTMSSNIAWMILYLIPVSLAFFCAYKIVKSNNLKLLAKLSICTIILLSLFNLFGLAILLSLILLLLNLIEWTIINKRILKHCVLVVFFNFVFWIIYGLTSDVWYQFFGDMQQLSVKKLLVILLKYPDIFEQILYPWMRTSPIFTIISALIICFGFCQLMNKPFEKHVGFRLLLSIALILCLFVGTVRTPYHETRYIFFLYPIIILLFTDSIRRLAELIGGNTRKSNVLLLIFILIYVACSEDFSVYHMRKIDSKEVNFRINYDFFKAQHYIVRMDYRCPAQIVNENIDDGHIVITTLSPTEYYLNLLDYSYIDYRGKAFWGISACAGNRNLWTNSKLIYKEDKLYNVVDNHPSTVWLIAASEKAKYRSRTSKKINEKYREYIFDKSVDGMINVYKINRDKV